MNKNKNDDLSSHSKIHCNKNEQFLEEKYCDILKNCSKNREISRQQMEMLASEYKFGQAQLYMGEHYRSLKRTRENFDKAVEWFQLASTNSDFKIANYAIFTLGSMFHSGGDYLKAKEFYEKAAKNGDDSARNALDVLEDDYNYY